MGENRSCSTCIFWQGRMSDAIGGRGYVTYSECVKDGERRSFADGHSCVQYKSLDGAVADARRMDEFNSDEAKDAIVKRIQDELIKGGALWNAVSLAVSQRMKEQESALRMLDETISGRISELAAIEVRMDEKLRKLGPML